MRTTQMAQTGFPPGADRAGNRPVHLLGGLQRAGEIDAGRLQGRAQADEYGARYSAQAGYDPHGIIQFFEKLKAMEGAQPAFAKYLSDNPATQDRITHLQQYIKDKGLTGSELGAERLQAVKQKLIANTRAAGAGSPTAR